MPRLADITVFVHYITDKAIRVSLDGDDEHAVWLPKSQVETNGEIEIGDTAEITMPEGYAQSKGLI